MNVTRHLVMSLMTLSTLWVLAGGCALRMSWPKHEVKVIASVAHPEALAQASITQLTMVYDAVELITCAALEDGPTIPGFTASALISTAHAHGPSTPTRQGVPFVLDWVSAAAPAALATFEPPPGDYCALRLDLGPADEDAVLINGGDERGGSMMGKTLRADRAQGAQGWHRAATGARADVTFYFEQPWRFPDDQDLHATLTLELDLAALLSHQSQPQAAQDEEQAGRLLLQGVRQSLNLERAW